MSFSQLRASFQVSDLRVVVFVLDFISTPAAPGIVGLVSVSGFVTRKFKFLLLGTEKHAPARVKAKEIFRSNTF